MELIVRERVEGRNIDKIYQYHEIDSLATNNSSEDSPKSARDIVFVTGSKNKVAELEEHLKPKYAKLTIVDLDLIEIQDSNLINIAEDKCRRAAERVLKAYPIGSASRGCVLVEDTSVHFNSLKGLPGPYIKWFVEALGPGGLSKMLDGFEDKSAEAVCTYALIENLEAWQDSKVLFFKGSVQGQITRPRGTSWGWDPVFEESRTGLTFAEMDRDAKSKFSHRANAITILKKYLTIVR